MLLLLLLQTLLLNQPKVQEQDDGSVVVVVHALIAMPNIVRPGGTLPSCRSAAPEYWLKLKRPQAIADVSAVASGTVNYDSASWQACLELCAST